MCSDVMCISACIPDYVCVEGEEGVVVCMYSGVYICVNRCMYVCMCAVFMCRYEGVEVVFKYLCTYVSVCMCIISR